MLRTLETQRPNDLSIPQLLRHQEHTALPTMKPIDRWSLRKDQHDQVPPSLTLGTNTKSVTMNEKDPLGMSPLASPTMMSMEASREKDLERFLAPRPQTSN